MDLEPSLPLRSIISSTYHHSFGEISLGIEKNSLVKDIIYSIGIKKDYQGLDFGLNYYNNQSDDHKSVLSEVNKEHLLRFINIRNEFDKDIKEKSPDIIVSSILSKLGLRYKLFYYLKKSINEV